MQPTKTTPATSSSSTATLPANRMTPEAAAALVETLHAKLSPIDGAWNRYSVPSHLAPTTLERRQLCAVVDRLERDLADIGDPTEREYEVATLLLGYEKSKGSELNAGLLNEQFLEAVEDQPLAAIRAACKRIRQGKPLTKIERGWRPSPDSFAEEVREGLIPVRARMVRARRILDVEVDAPPTEEELARVAARAEAYRLRRMPTQDHPGLVVPDLAPPRPADLVAPLRDLQVSPGLMARLDERKDRHA
ncbi:hypothetical protein [uncultured Methylobacterium sp.]|uniref:hypothetical protein n=1 Tax=uncultured Methylobacterium sp. TaxID=157278 RepID=UPI0035CBE8E2